LTGGTTQFPGLRERIEKEFRMIRPVLSEVNVSVAQNGSLDAWRGARSWANSTNFLSSAITKAQYQELGAEYLQEHFASNIFLQ